MELSKEQNEAIDKGLDPTINTLYVTGPGGTGKSEIIKRLMSKLNPFETVLLAPTQSAAINIGGRTIHSFFKIRPTININVEKEADVISFCLDEVDTDNLDGKIVIIDEASMLGEQMLTGILSRIKPKKLILFGDPDQLKPIKDNAVDWEAFCDETVHLTFNYRVQNEDLRKIIDYFRDTGKISPDTNKIESIDHIEYDKNTVYMAHTNETLSAMQKSLIGYSNAKIGDTLLTFGSCDESIQRVIVSGKKEILAPYFGNNDLVVARSIPRMIDKNLWSVDVILKEDDDNQTDSIVINQYNKIPKVIVGDYTVYKKTLQRRFKSAQRLQNQMKEKYKTDNNAIMKKKMSVDEKDDLRLIWINYFNLKNSPYARHNQFRTTYKAQGQSFDKVIIDWYDLPGKDHRYVAISRAMNNLTLIAD